MRFCHTPARFHTFWTCPIRFCIGPGGPNLEADVRAFRSSPSQYRRLSSSQVRTPDMYRIRLSAATSVAPPATWRTDSSMASKDFGSSYFQRGWAPGAVHRMVVSCAGKTGGSSGLVRSLRPDRPWWLLEVLEGWDSLMDILGIRPSVESFMLVPLAWLSRWEHVTAGVVTPVFLTCATMLMTAAATLACDGTCRGAVVLGGEAGTVSSIPSSANSSRAEEGTKPCADCAVTVDGSTEMAGPPDVMVGGSWKASSLDCAAVAPPNGRTSPSGIGGLGLLPQRPSWNAGQRWLRINSWTGTL